MSVPRCPRLPSISRTASREGREGKRPLPGDLESIARVYVRLIRRRDSLLSSFAPIEQLNSAALRAPLLNRLATRAGESISQLFDVKSEQLDTSGSLDFIPDRVREIARRIGARSVSP